MARRRLSAVPDGGEGLSMWATTSTLNRAAGQAEGGRRRDEALRLLRDRRAVYIRRGQRALLLALLDGGTATADAVRAAVELPPDIDPRCLGAVPHALAEAGIVARSGYAPSARPERHASILAVWALADRDAALRWLADHPELPESDRGEPAQRTLWD
jgi:hypothetical protein